MDMEELIKQVEHARHNFIAAASGHTYEQACFKPSPESWSIIENAEHMVWAEQGGINGIWKTIEGIKNNVQPGKIIYIPKNVRHSFHASSNRIIALYIILGPF